MSTADRSDPPPPRAGAAGPHPCGTSPLVARIRAEVARAQLRMDASVLRGDGALGVDDPRELRAALDEQRAVVAETEARLAAVVREAVTVRDGALRRPGQLEADGG